MSIARDLYCFDVPLTMLFVAILSVVAGDSGCWCPIFAKAVRVEVAFCWFSNKSPSSDSMNDAITFLMMLHSTCIGPFSGGISYIGVLGFVPRKEYLPALLCDSGYDM